MMNSKIPLPQLETFLMYAKSDNMSEAAKSLGISQPGVSLHLSQLQDLLPFPLFKTLGRKKQLTPYGAAIQQAIESSLVKIPRAIESVNNQYRSIGQTHVKVGGRPEFFEFFSGSLGNVGGIDFLSCSSEEALKQILKGTIDIAISHKIPYVHHLVRRKLLTSGVRLIVHKKFVKKGLDRPYCDKVFLKTTPGLFYRLRADYISNWLSYNDLSEKEIWVKTEVTDWSMITQFVTRGLGYALVPDSVKVDSRQVKCFPIENSIIPHRNFYLIYPKSFPHKKMITSAIDSVAAFSN